MWPPSLQHHPWLCSLVTSGSPSQHLSSTVAHSDILSSPSTDLSVTQLSITSSESSGVSPGPSHLSLRSPPCAHSLTLKFSPSSLRQCFSGTPTLAFRSLLTDQYFHSSSPLDQAKLLINPSPNPFSSDTVVPVVLRKKSQSTSAPPLCKSPRSS